MNIIDTRSLFHIQANRLSYTFPLVKVIFPNMAPAAVHYELLKQGLFENGAMTLQLNVWDIVEKQVLQLKNAWQGPITQIAILPITQGFIKNGVAYKNGICLFVSAELSEKALQALITHEYHHICRLAFQKEPPTLLDSIILEGLAEQAVESLFGEHALSTWTKRYSLEEATQYWHTHFLNDLHERGLFRHTPYLFGDEARQLPPYIGYCMGYRIVEAFLTNNRTLTVAQLLPLSSEQIALGAGLTIKKR